MYDFSEDYTCTIKVDVNTNRDGNICQAGDTVAGKKTLTFRGINSSVTAAEVVNDDDDQREDKALHNGISALMWLFSGTDDNFDPLTIKKISKAEMDYE